ncbi:phenylalanine--tRNA ligase beta subunit-related protein [Blattabacterium cuenoti]|uniref:phenylalanine--tRNA ligase beta subunit-related protein n=1 Tax=Blattabacterium cuenoti TaxID=1653831 RepID=UPI00163C5650|nr:phenylalanine--tRNA ligase beta subunit-related protein [Blattabacterium cuenoti]
MKISYNWLKQYINFNLNIKKISDILINLGFLVKNIQNNIIDIEMPPNRPDAISYYGIARDLYAFLKFKNYKKNVLFLNTPKVYQYHDNENLKQNNFQISIDPTIKCIRYSYIIIFNTKIDKSPPWLQTILESIGIKSINNIIDLTNFIMYELGQPIQILNIDQIEGKKIFIKLTNNIHLKNQVEVHTNHTKCMIIYDIAKPLLIRNNQLINENINQNILLLCINLPYKNIQHFDLHNFIQNDSIRFLEKNIDPNNTLRALSRFIFLLEKINNKKIFFSNIIDNYLKPIYPIPITIRYKKIIDVIGKRISKQIIKQIILLLVIKIIEENEKSLTVLIPIYRIDIKREIDLIEEIIRIYGINKITNKYNNKLKTYPYTYYYNNTTTSENIKYLVTNQLINHGFQEVINLPMINDKNQEIIDLNSYMKIKSIHVKNPINKHYDSMRTNLFFGMINNLKSNFHKTDNDIKFFELGKIFYDKKNHFCEKNYLGLSILESKNNNNSIEYLFLYLKGILEQIFQKTGIKNYTQKISNHPLLHNSILMIYKKNNLAEIGIYKNHIKGKQVVYAEIYWEYFILSVIKNKNFTLYKHYKFPILKRDLSILVDKNILFETIYQTLKKQQYKLKLIKNIQISDLYEGKNLPISKKSYMIRFWFGSNKQTLTNSIITNLIDNIIIFLKKELGADIRRNI